jgi:hypothetical protein
MKSHVNPDPRRAREFSLVTAFGALYQGTTFCRVVSTGMMRPLGPEVRISKEVNPGPGIDLNPLGDGSWRD